MFPYFGELSHFYNTHVCVLTFLVKLKWLILFCRCGCACVCGCAVLRLHILPTHLALSLFLQDFDCWRCAHLFWGAQRGVSTPVLWCTTPPWASSSKTPRNIWEHMNQMWEMLLQNILTTYWLMNHYTISPMYSKRKKKNPGTNYIVPKSVFCNHRH